MFKREKNTYGPQRNAGIFQAEPADMRKIRMERQQQSDRFPGVDTLLSVFRNTEGIKYVSHEVIDVSLQADADDNFRVCERYTAASPYFVQIQLIDSSGVNHTKTVLVYHASNSHDEQIISRYSAYAKQSQTETDLLEQGAVVGGDILPVAIEDIEHSQDLLTTFLSFASAVRIPREQEPQLITFDDRHITQFYADPEKFRTFYRRLRSYIKRVLPESHVSNLETTYHFTELVPLLSCSVTYRKDGVETVQQFVIAPRSEQIHSFVAFSMALAEAVGEELPSYQTLPSIRSYFSQRNIIVLCVYDTFRVKGWLENFIHDSLVT